MSKTEERKTVYARVSPEVYDWLERVSQIKVDKEEIVEMILREYMKKPIEDVVKDIAVFRAKKVGLIPPETAKE